MDRIAGWIGLAGARVGLLHPEESSAFDGPRRRVTLSLSLVAELVPVAICGINQSGETHFATGIVKDDESISLKPEFTAGERQVVSADIAVDDRHTIDKSGIQDLETEPQHVHSANNRESTWLFFGLP